MRQRLIIAALSAVLFLSGWGGVFASATCRQDDESRAGVEESHACCRAQAKESAEKESADAESSATHCPLSEAVAPEKNAHGASADGGDATASAASIADARFADFAPDACAHCFVRSENPPARFALPEPPARKRADAPYTPGDGRLLNAPPVASYAPASVSRGGAPPGASPPRHVLHSVFLI